MVPSWWFWGVLFLVGGLWYVGEPIFLLYQLLREERETDPLLSFVKNPYKKTLQNATYEIIRKDAWLGMISSHQARSLPSSATLRKVIHRLSTAFAKSWKRWWKKW